MASPGLGLATEMSAQILTHALLEGHYVPAARVMGLIAVATSERDNDLLRCALQTFHLAFPDVQRKS